MKQTSFNDIAGISTPRRQVEIHFVPSSPVSFDVTTRDRPSGQTITRLSQRVIKKVPSPSRLIDFGFYLKAPVARCVNLAADFTHWDKFPVEMTRRADGLWHAIIPLSPGRYEYRFMVDGQWCGGSHLLEKRADAVATSVWIHP
jgi:1,4-alpha-glucan branching enzyme